MISVIVPVYNTANYLKECIESIITQSYQEIELLLIDDGSIDKSSHICDEYASAYDNVKVVHIDNSGVSNARNVGLGLAQGEWVTFVDSDDFISRDYCEKLLSNASDDVDLVIGRTISFSGNQFNDDGYRLAGKVIYKEDKSQLFKSLFVDNPKLNVIPHISTCSAKLIRKSLIDSIGLRYSKDIRFYEDALFNAEIMIRSSSIVVISNKIYFYRQLINSSSNRAFDVKQYTELYSKFEILDAKYDFNFGNYYNYFKIKNLNIIITNASFSHEFNNEFVKNACGYSDYATALKKINISILPKRRKALVLLSRLKQYWAIVFIYKMIGMKKNEVK